MSELKRMLTGHMATRALASLCIRIFALMAGFGFAVAVARLLGPAGYGRFAVAFSVATIASIVAAMGINQLAIRQVAVSLERGDHGELRGFVEWAIVATAGISILLALGVAMLAPLGGFLYSDEIAIAAAAIPVLTLTLVAKGISQGADEILASQVPGDVIRWVLVFCFIFLLVLSGREPSPSLILVILIAAGGMSLGLSLWLVRRMLLRAGSAARTRKGREWLAAAVPFFGIAALGIVGTEANTLILGWLAGPTEAGLYQPIARISLVMLLGVEAILIPLGPRIAGLWERGDKERLARLIARSTAMATMATAAIAGTLVVASTQILAFFGSEFLQYRHVLLWIAGAQIVSAAMGASPLLLMMLSRMRERMWAQVGTMVVQIGLGMALIPSLGAAGAALSLTVAIVVWALLHWLIALRLTRIDTSLMGAIRMKRLA